jgi:WD40-like Beta Propeller Repeat
MGADGSNPTHVTANRGYGHQPAWSPDGHKIAFTGTRADGQKVRIMNSDGSGETAFTSGPITGHEANADWQSLPDLQLPASAPAGGQPVGGGEQGSTAGSDTVAPLIGDFRATPARFAVTRAKPLASRVARGTRFRFTLSEPARVTLKIRRVLPGRRARYRTVGTLERSSAKGANRIRFKGRIGRRTLRRGPYRALIRAVDAAGNRSSRRIARFRIARG